MKITGNFFIVSSIETIAEGMALAEKNGISRQEQPFALTPALPGGHADNAGPVCVCKTCTVFQTDFFLHHVQVDGGVG